MKLSFGKNIQGHDVEFVRLLYPHRYQLYIKSADQDGAKLVLNKDKSGVWTIVQPLQVPGYINEISLSLHEAIEDNELSIEE